MVYPTAIPQDVDILSTNRNTMIALGYLVQAAFGPGPLVDGLACTPVTASMQVQVGTGSIISLQNIDATNFGSIPADTSDPLVKMGINPTGSTVFSLTAPVTSGQSINYVIEGEFQELDAGAAVLPYYNVGNPQQPFSGPNNSGVSNNTVRQQRVALQLKQGVAATTGSQVNPPIDAGWVGLWVITVAFGQTQIVAGNISQYPGAPFIRNKIGAGGAGFSNAQTFTSNSSFTVPNGVTKIKATIVGGGSGSSGCNASNYAGACGGGGGYAIGIFSVTPGQIIPITIGSGGGAASPGAASGAGGTTTFGTYMTATGATSANSTGGENGGIGGAGSGGYLNGSGDDGSDGSQAASPAYWPGKSGGSLFGGSRRSFVSASGSNNAGINPGAGGGSPYYISGTASAGTIGAPGICIVEW